MNTTVYKDQTSVSSVSNFGPSGSEFHLLLFRKVRLFRSVSKSVSDWW